MNFIDFERDQLVKTTHKKLIKSHEKKPNKSALVRTTVLMTSRNSRDIFYR